MDWMQFVASMTSSIAWPIASIAIIFVFKEGILKRLPDLSRLSLPGGLSAEFNQQLAFVEARVENNGEIVASIPPSVLNDNREISNLGAGLLTDDQAEIKHALNAEEGHSSATHSWPTTSQAPATEMTAGADDAGGPYHPVFEPRSEHAVRDNVALRANPTGVVMESWKVLETALRALAKHVATETPGSTPQIGILQTLEMLKKQAALSLPEIAILRKMLEMRNMAAHSNEPIGEENAKRFQEIAESMARGCRAKITN
jgi:hypothetical protein